MDIRASVLALKLALVRAYPAGKAWADSEHLIIIRCLEEIEAKANRLEAELKMAHAMIRNARREKV